MKNNQKFSYKQKRYFRFLNLFHQNCRYCIFKSNSYGMCSSCFKYFTYFLKPSFVYINKTKIISLSRYIFNIRNEILQFKLRDHREISKFFILSIFNYPNLLSDLSRYEYISYVPMDKEKENYQRGYNQAKVIAKDLSVFLGIPIIDLIEKIKVNKTQSTVLKEERYINVKDVYRIKAKKSFNNILLVDDIYTTGATVLEIKKKIKEKYSNSNVDVFVLSKVISINKNISSLIARKYKYIKLLNSRKSIRKRILEQKYRK